MDEATKSSRLCCPIEGCGNTYLYADALRCHVNHVHHNTSNADQKLDSLQTAYLQFLSRDNSNSFPKLATPAAVPIPAVLSPPRSPHLAQKDLDDSNREWIEQSSSNWPPSTEAYLKKLIISHGLYKQAQTDEEQKKLRAMLERFYAKTTFRGWKPAKDDERLWQLFSRKVGQMQAQMVLDGEVVPAKEGGFQHHSSLSRSTSEAFSATIPTPPATSVKPDSLFCNALLLWNALDSETQIQLLHEQLRSSKDPRRLKSELYEVCAADRASMESNRRKEMREEYNKKGSTPVGVTPPTELQPLDLQAIFEERLRELRMKKLMNKKVVEEATSEGRAPKRVRAEVL